MSTASPDSTSQASLDSYESTLVVSPNPSKGDFTTLQASGPRNVSRSGITILRLGSERSLGLVP